MKKLIFGMATLLAVSMMFFGCYDVTTEPGSSTTTTDTTTTDGGSSSGSGSSSSTDSGSTSGTSSSTETADKVLWSDDSGKVFTTNAYDVYLALDKVVDLTGYKYLNVEFSAESNASGQNVIIQPMTEAAGGHPQGNILQPGAVSKGTYQTKFGTNYGAYTDWSTGSAVEKTIEDNLLGSLQLYAQETTNWGTVKDVEITVYKVTATNTEIK